MENKELRLEDKYWFGVFRWKLVVGLFILLLIVALGSDNEIRLVIPARAMSPLVWGCFCLIGATVAAFRRRRPGEEDFWERHGCAFLVSMVVGTVLFGFFLSGPCVASEKARLISCRANLQQIWNALQAYASDNKNFLPPGNGATGLNELLRRGYLAEPVLFHCPGRSGPAGEFQELTEENCDYIYYGGGEQSYDRKGILLMDKPGNHPEQKYNILYYNGEIESRGGW